MIMNYYFPTNGNVYTSQQVASLFGIDPATASITTLNIRGFYPVQESPLTIDTHLYSVSAVYTVEGSVAVQSWEATPLPLEDAKYGGVNEAKAAMAREAEITNTAYGLNAFSFAAVSSQAFPPARYQAVLDSVSALTDRLDADLTAIESATSVDEIDSILKGPSGTIVTGRGGAGPLDMQPSYFTDLLNLPPGVGEPELEIYIPGTDTIIPYDAGLPDPYKFDSMGNCYTGTDYRTVIRVAATGQVLSTVIPALGPAVPIAWTYNPNIPSAGGSSSHSA